MPVNSSDVISTHVTNNAAVQSPLDSRLNGGPSFFGFGTRSSNRSSNIVPASSSNELIGNSGVSEKSQASPLFDTKSDVSGKNVNYPAASSPEPTAAPPPPSPFVQKVLDLTNTERAKAGLQPLQLNAKLNSSAQAHSEDMAYNDFFDHKRSNGPTLGDRVKNAGYNYARTGENIAAGYASAEQVVQEWMKSPEHKKNIMSSEYKEIGIGYFYLANDTGNTNLNHYWTQDFGKAL